MKIFPALFLSFLLLISVSALASPTADKIIVYKAARSMELLNAQGNVLRSYRIALGGNPQGHKTQEGDEKTPEGLYSISGRNPRSAFYLSLRISYPNAQDVAQAQARGVSPGGDIMIHGMRNRLGWIGSLHLLYDTWTNGCIAVTDDEIEEIWKLVPDGTIIDIRP